MCRYGGLYYSKHSSIKCRRSGKRVELSGHLNECRIARSIARIFLPQSEVYPSNILYPSFSTSPPLTPLLLNEPVMKVSLKTRKFRGILKFHWRSLKGQFIMFLFSMPVSSRMINIVPEKRQPWIALTYMLMALTYFQVIKISLDK